MLPRSPGRPRADHPRDVKVTIRLTEVEADLLQRTVGTAGRGSLSAVVRLAVSRFIDQLGGAHTLADTPDALIRRELRKAKRLASPEADALLPVFALDALPEPSSAGKPVYLTVENVPDPYEGKVFTIEVTHLPDSPPGRTDTRKS